MSVVWSIIVTALRRVARDRLGLFFIVALPFIIILLFGVGGGQNEADLRVGVAPEDGADASAVLDALENEDALALRTYERAEALERAVRRGDLEGGVVVTSGEEGGPEGTLWVANPQSAAGPAARVAASSAIAALDARLVAVDIVTDTLGVDQAAAEAAASDIETEPLLSVEEETTQAEAFTFGVDESAQHNLVLFTFITSLTGSVALIESRRLGISKRMLASPASVGTVMFGEAAARFTIALVQALIVLAGATVMFGTDWGNPLAVAAIIGLFCLVGTGAAMLFGAMLSNAEQAGSIAAPLGIALGMLGGALWPLEIVPPAMQAIGRAMPHAWAIDALREVGSQGGGLSDIAGALLALTAFAAVLLGVATWRLGITLRR